MTDDIDFKTAMLGVRRLKKESVHPNAQTAPSRQSLRLQIRQRAIDSATPPQQPASLANPGTQPGHNHRDGDPEVFFLRQGVQKKVLRKLKRGVRYPYEKTLDLHGLSQSQAEQKINHIVASLDPDRLICLLIIHGKGLHSPQGARLKQFTIDYLKTLAGVKAYCSAQLRDGGTGAVYVLIRG